MYLILRKTNLRPHVYIKEKKTGKVKKFLLNKNAVGALSRLKKKLKHKMIRNIFLRVERDKIGQLTVIWL